MRRHHLRFAVHGCMSQSCPCLQMPASVVEKQTGPQRLSVAGHRELRLPLCALLWVVHTQAFFAPLVCLTVLGGGAHYDHFAESHGLSQSEAERRLRKHGPNTLEDKKTPKVHRYTCCFKRVERGDRRGERGRGKRSESRRELWLIRLRRYSLIG